MEQASVAMETEFVDIYHESMKNEQEDKYLTFTIGQEEYGLEIKYITEIVVIQEITMVPDMPQYMKGVINLRGNVISVMDMRNRFHLEDREYDDRTCIIVVDLDKLQIGLIVDSVKEVSDIPATQVDPPPATHYGLKSGYVKGMGKLNDSVKILLDVEKILYEKDLEVIQQI